MKHKKIFFLNLCSVMVIGAAICAYISIDHKHLEESKISENEKKENIEIYNPIITESPESVSEEKTQEIAYLIRSEKNYLILYETNGNIQKEINRFEINPEMFPFEDRELLKKGIKANSLEEGIEIAENFISWTKNKIKEN